jgi:hypothetical protein
VGLAVLATLSTTRTEHLTEQGHSLASALVGGYHLAFLIGVGSIAAAIVVAVTVLQAAPAPAGAHAAPAEADDDALPSSEAAYSEMV